MGTYRTQSAIIPDELAKADDPDKMIRATEARVRRALEGAPTDDPETLAARGETVIGWVARIEGSPRPAPWDPATDAVPEGADLLTCMGRRTS